MKKYVRFSKIGGQRSVSLDRTAGRERIVRKSLEQAEAVS